MQISPHLHTTKRTVTIPSSIFAWKYSAWTMQSPWPRRLAIQTLLHRISALFVVLRALQMSGCSPWALMLIFCRSRSSTVAVAALALEFQCKSILWQHQSTAMN
ncbi:hypothetical protein C8R48DRAFT_738250 [Suillus tomentosus]|nr:hypothetical protein C8R48DRAFT_738250 [Suillus tomentosus]